MSVEPPLGWPAQVGVVYGFRAPGSEEFRYIGITSAPLGRRMRQHLQGAAAGKRKTPFYDWLRKQPVDVVEVQPLEVVRTTLQDLGAAEQKWIAHYRAQGHRLLNLSDGGLGPVGVKWTAEQRQAASLRNRGRKHEPKFGSDNPFYGGHHSSEQKAKWSAERSGSITGEKNPNFGKFGAQHPGFGHKLSDETKARLSAQKLGALNPNFGKQASDETRAKMSAVRKGRPMPSSVRSAHTRYHTNKGVFKETCTHCVEDAAQERETE